VSSLRAAKCRALIPKHHYYFKRRFAESISGALMVRPFSFARVFLMTVLVGTFCGAVAAQTPMDAPDMPKKFEAPKTGYDYEKRDVMIPMRDGVKLFTVIVVPKGAHNAPMILTRTPYNAAGRAARFHSFSMLATLPQGDEVFVADGYIRVFQDIRGKNGSEGDFVMTRPLRGPLNLSSTDESTDAYDTIDWLGKNVTGSNGKN